MRAALPLESKPLDKNDPNRLRAGTLQYTMFSLIALFVWLLWGDFCYTLHDQVVSKVIPLAFKRHNAPNWVMGLFMQSVAAVLNFTLNPIISTASDRTRTRWGRRIPYLIFSAPINAGCLALLGFSEQIGAYMADASGWAKGATIVGVMAACLALFRMTNAFVSSVYYYLFNDVVPHAYLSRFSSLFRAVAMLTNAGFNYFFLQYAEAYMKDILLATAGLYIVGYTLMCVMVKEGEYPPPPSGMTRRDSKLRLMVTYMKECFFHRFFWYFFIYNALWEMTRATESYQIFMYRDSLGITLDQYGKIGGISMLLTAALLYPAGMLADKMHPLRFMRVTVLMQCFLSLLMCNWLFWNPDARTSLLVYIGLMCLFVPLNSMHNAAALPLIMRLFPRDRFGQFSSANAMVVSLLGMVIGVIAGAFLDIMIAVYNSGHGSTFGYRYVPVWSLAFMILSAVFLLLVHKHWKKLGGLEHYVPPAAEKPGE